MKRLEAEILAKGFIGLIGAYVARAEIAGSLRRSCKEVGDIEIVAQPWTPQSAKDLHAKLQELLNAGLVELDRKSSDGKRPPFGPRYYRLTYSGKPLDLFLVLPPADWGIIYTLCTGPAEYSHWIVTEALRRGFKVADGQLFKRSIRGPWVPVREKIPCPQEADFFKALGLKYQTPELREIVGTEIRNRHEEALNSLVA